MVRSSESDRIEWRSSSLDGTMQRRMSFFESREPKDFEPPEEPTRQPWQGPPPGWIGGYVPWQIHLVKTPKAHVVLRNFEAFPDGLRFSLVTHVIHAGEAGPDTHMLHLGSRGIRLGVIFADGRAARSDDDYWQEEGEPDHPVLSFDGGGGGGGRIRSWESRCWLWPTPPEGPLTWIVEWAAVDVPETSVTAGDGVAIQGAAVEAEQVLQLDITIDDGGMTLSKGITYRKGQGWRREDI